MVTEDFYVVDNEHDAQAVGRSTNYLTAWGTCWATDFSLCGIGQYYTVRDPIYTVRRSFLRIDTRNLPAGAIITAAKLRGYCESDSTTDDFIVRIQKWTGDIPITCADYTQYDDVNYDDGLFNTSALAVGKWFEITLTDFDVIVKEGYTLLCIRSAEDIAKSPPVQSEEFAMGDVYFGHAAHLRITYTVPKKKPIGDGLTFAI